MVKMKQQIVDQGKWWWSTKDNRRSSVLGPDGRAIELVFFPVLLLAGRVTVPSTSAPRVSEAEFREANLDKTLT